ncbi:phenoloxidase-activating factor 2-like [Amphibalanus amphitrite]|uniref:phenoloxidase-activating factor 2-like n=1 Tax=Amphibalanus amphitrite TaxID=1232801 RepID=UPI001C91D722|nr:phenoloxidase-activating factor 2-like [Amphibalanus amphitrite]
MRCAVVLLAWLGVASAQLSAEDQSFIDAALGTGGSTGVDPQIGGQGGGQGPPADGEYPPCDNGRKSCVPYYLCEDGQIVTDGAGVIDLRFGGTGGDQHIQHSDCKEQYTSVCCADPQRVPVIPEPIKQPYQPVCGRRNAFGIHARIVGIQENEAQFGEYPWMAAVLKEDGGKLVFLCGASLIGTNVLATAAHCVYGQTNLVVRLGEWDTQHTTEFYPHLDADVVSVVVHEGYNHARQNLHNDIALLFLNGEVPLQEHIDTICLPEANSQPVYGENCFATGWGKDSFEQGQFQLVLKQVALPLVNHGTCQNQLRATRLGSRFILDRSFLCAGGNGADTCTGDGGSPLVCPDPTNPDRYILRGIVAWGIGCGTINVPGVYVDVTYFSTWINNQILNHQPLP